MDDKVVLHRRFQFRPSWIMVDALGGYASMSPMKWFAIYQWFVQRLLEYQKQKKDSFYEYLNGTSSINNECVYAMRDAREPRRRLAMLLAHVGEEYGHGDFLRFCDLKEWSDLNKPITVSLPHTRIFPRLSWFELRGRVFKVSPNECHPKATWIMSGAVRPHYKGKLWEIKIEYGYIHDSSHWWRTRKVS